MNKGAESVAETSLHLKACRPSNASAAFNTNKGTFLFDKTTPMLVAKDGYDSEPWEDVT